MNLRAAFLTDTGALRAPWRIAVFCVVSMASVIVAAEVLAPLVMRAGRAAGIDRLTSASWVELIGVLVGTAICLRWIDHRPWSDVWLDRAAARPLRLVAGFTLGASCIGLPIVALIAAGWLREIPGGGGSWWTATARSTLMLLPAALLEELMTRGYLLSVLQRWWGWGWAVVATSIAFGLLHLANEGATAESVALVTVAGVFLAGVLYATRSLYAAWMAHFAWNWTMAALFHASVSGLPFEAPAYRYVDAGPDWLTGGAWGPEGGLAAALGMGAGAAVLYAARRVRPRPAAEEDESH